MYTIVFSLNTYALMQHESLIITLNQTLKKDSQFFNFVESGKITLYSIATSETCRYLIFIGCTADFVFMDVPIKMIKEVPMKLSLFCRKNHYYYSCSKRTTWICNKVWDSFG